MRLFSIALFGTLVASCSSVSGPEFEERLVPGTVQFHAEPIVIEVPDSVDVGVDFIVRVRTYGGGCERIGTTLVDSSSGGPRPTATVEPRDFTRIGPEVVCTAELRAFHHEAVLRFDVPGTATVVVRGRQLPEDVIRAFERTVHIREP